MLPCGPLDKQIRLVRTDSDTCNIATRDSQRGAEARLIWSAELHNIHFNKNDGENRGRRIGDGDGSDRNRGKVVGRVEFGVRKSEMLTLCYRIRSD